MSSRYSQAAAVAAAETWDRNNQLRILRERGEHAIADQLIQEEIAEAIGRLATIED